MQGGIVADGTVAALMQALSGGVQRQGDLVIENREVQLELDTGLGQPLDTILFTQALGAAFLMMAWQSDTLMS